MKVADNALQNPDGKMMNHGKKPSLVQVSSKHLTQGLPGSFDSFHNILMPNEPAVQPAQMASLQLKDLRVFLTFQYL